MAAKILVADDNGTIRALLRSSLENAGYAVCGEAENGAAAITLATELRPDLVLLDLSMPVMNGAEASSILKQRMPGVPIILFTLHAEDIGEALRKAIGADLVLAKPDGLGRLTECIEALLAVSGNLAPTLGPLALPMEPLAAAAAPSDQSLTATQDTTAPEISTLDPLANPV